MKDESVNFCSNCGESLANAGKFCGKCGFSAVESYRTAYITARDAMPEWINYKEARDASPVWKIVGTLDDSLDETLEENNLWSSARDKMPEWWIFYGARKNLVEYNKWQKSLNNNSKVISNNTNNEDKSNIDKETIGGNKPTGFTLFGWLLATIFCALFVPPVAIISGFIFIYYALRYSGKW